MIDLTQRQQGHVTAQRSVGTWLIRLAIVSFILAVHHDGLLNIRWTDMILCVHTFDAAICLKETFVRKHMPL